MLSFDDRRQQKASPIFFIFFKFMLITIKLTNEKMKKHTNINHALFSWPPYAPSEGLYFRLLKSQRLEHLNWQKNIYEEYENMPKEANISSYIFISLEIE